MDATGTAYPTGHALFVAGTVSVPIPTNIPPLLHATYLAASPTVRGSLILGFPVAVVAPTQDAINASLLQALQDLREQGAAAKKVEAEEADKKKGKKVGAMLTTKATPEQTRAALDTDSVASLDNIPASLYDRMHPRSQYVKVLYFSEEYITAYSDPTSAASKEIAANMSMPLRAPEWDDFDSERLDIWIAAEHRWSEAMVKARYFTELQTEQRADLTLSLGFLKALIIKLHGNANFAPQRRAAFIYHAEILARTIGGQSGGSADVSRLDAEVWEYAKEVSNGHEQQRLARALASSGRSVAERTREPTRDQRGARGSGERDARHYGDSRDSRFAMREDSRYQPYPSPTKPFSSRGDDQQSNTPAPARKQSTSVCFFCGSTVHNAKQCQATVTRACKHDPTNNKWYIDRIYPPEPPTRYPFYLATSDPQTRLPPRIALIPTLLALFLSSRTVPKLHFASPASTETTVPVERATATASTSAPSARSADAEPSSTPTPTKESRSDEEVAWEWAHKITTPLISRAWRKLLGLIHPKSAKPYAHFPDSIDGGFDIGIPPSVIIETTRAPKPTRPQTAEEYQGTQRHIVEEQFDDRFSPELRRAAVESALGPFQTSPTIPVPKEVTPEKNPWRIVRHFSSPENGSYPSVNDQLREYPVFLPTYWTPIAEFGNIVLNASCDAQALVVDVKDAFRIIPIRPEQRRWTVIQWGLGYIIDTSLVMGLVPSTDIWGSLVDLMRMYFAVMFVLVIVRNWVDDIVHIAEPPVGSTFASLEASLLAVYVWLGVPLSHHKTVSFSPIFPFCGYIWDLQTKYVYLKPSKRKKYLAAMEELLTGTVSVSQERMEQIGGFLSHLCYLVSGLDEPPLSQGRTSSSGPSRQRATLVAGHL
ncbi:hypothetical protein P7C70_g8189, partial [Phenoliferia sp. Uapishka_3]